MKRNEESVPQTVPFDTREARKKGVGGGGKDIPVTGRGGP
jgi:hypothetical protein